MKYSLHFGLNKVDPAAYAGWDGVLYGCQNDAQDLATLFARVGYEAKVFFDSAVTLAGFHNRISELAAIAKVGDQVIISYSGHGGQQLSIQGAAFTSETFCLYDGQLFDTEFRSLLGLFAEGVDGVCILDSCHSGGMDRAFKPTALKPRRFRVMPRDVQARMPQKAILGLGEATVNASWLMLCACRPDQLAEDGNGNGEFTGAIKSVFRVPQTWGEIYKFVANKMSNETPDETPCYHLLGPVKPALMANTI